MPDSAANRVARMCSLLTKMVSPIRLNSVDNQAMVGSRLISGGTFYFVRDIDAVLRAGGDEPNKKDLTLDLQGHKVKALDLQNCPYKSVTIKNGTIEGIGEVIATKAPTVLILDSVTTERGHSLITMFTLTVKGDCVFQHQDEFPRENPAPGRHVPTWNQCRTWCAGPGSAGGRICLCRRR